MGGGVRAFLRRCGLIQADSSASMTDTSPLTGGLDALIMPPHTPAVQHRAEHQMENLYRRLLEFTRDSVHRYTFADGTILMANQGFVDILDLDYKPEDVVGRPVAELIEYVEEPGTIRAELEKKGEIHGFEYRFRTLKGDDRWVVHDSFLTMDTETGEKVVDAITRDITFRKVTEQSLRESEAKYRDLVENARDGICIIHDGTLVYVNQ
ncbi:MAG: PAS domain S-box protein, partial [Lentisphaerae bacterium]|nr:PAS domain S-box protein [Lentisphaerota bacterium]